MSAEHPAAQGHGETCELLTVESSIKCTCGPQEAWMAAHTDPAEEADLFLGPFEDESPAATPSRRTWREGEWGDRYEQDAKDEASAATGVCTCKENSSPRLRCDGGCGFTSDEGKFGDRCPNCGLGVLVPGEAEKSAAQCQDDRIPTLRWYRWHYSLAFWRLLRRPFLHKKRWTRTELWLSGRAVNAKRRLFGWTD